jgi:hypothetical protein
VWALRFTRGTSRAFIIVPAERHEDLVERRIRRLLQGPWGRLGHFVDELQHFGVAADGVAPNDAIPPRTRVARGTRRPCSCGCGGLTQSRFMPGHDSRLRAWVLKVERGLVALDQIPDGERQAVEGEVTRKRRKAMSRAPDPK